MEENNIKDRKLTFSQREGYENIPEPLRLEELSEEVRNELELCLTKALELYYDEKNFKIAGRKKETANWEEITRDLWVQFLNMRLQHYQGMHQAIDGLVRIIHFEEFNSVFDILEELVNRTAKEQPLFYKSIEDVFDRRRVAYRLVGHESTGFVIIPTTNNFEVSIIKNAFEFLSINSTRFDLVIKHLVRSGQHLRKGDNGKSIAEAASAVEVTLRILIGIDKEYNVVLKKFLKKVEIHPSLKERISIPYVLASDISDGRHASKVEGYEADQFDAQYVYGISCSTVQYLINKSASRQASNPREVVDAK